MSRRAVFDTNVVVSALVFDGRIATAVRLSWIADSTPLASADTVAELQAVLRYRKFKLTPEEIEELLGDYLPHVETVASVEACPVKCRDVRDQKFLDLAHSAAAEVLVSGDDDLLVLGTKTRFRILRPAEFLGR